MNRLPKDFEKILKKHGIIWQELDCDGNDYGSYITWDGIEREGEENWHECSGHELASIGLEAIIEQSVFTYNGEYQIWHKEDCYRSDKYLDCIFKAIMEVWK